MHMFGSSSRGSSLKSADTDESEAAKGLAYTIEYHLLCVLVQTTGLLRRARIER